jgi:hypothetical protein
MSEKIQKQNPVALDFYQRIRVAYGHYCLGLDQHDLAALMGVNAGRVAEACVAVRLAVENPQKAYELLGGKNGK